MKNIKHKVMTENSNIHCSFVDALFSINSSKKFTGKKSINAYHFKKLHN